VSKIAVAQCAENQIPSVTVAESAPGTETPHYDRDFLLSPGKSNQVMALWEVEQFGTDSFGDPDYVSIYDMGPAEWYARGLTQEGASYESQGGPKSLS